MNFKAKNRLGDLVNLPPGGGRWVLLLGLLAAAVCSLSANTTLIPVPCDNAFHQRFLARAAEGDIDILFLGDSITQYWEDPKRGLPVWQKEFAGRKAANFGINGNRIQHVLWRLQNGETEGFTPKVVVLLLGTNNTTPRNTTGEVVEGLRTVVLELRARFPSAKILLLGLLPRDAKDHPRRLQIPEINKGLAALNDNKTVFYLDIGDRFLDAAGGIPVELMPDGLHPNLRGYEIMAGAIREPLAKLLVP